MTGNGRLRDTRFAALPATTVRERLSEDWMADVVSASCTPIRGWAFSAWSELVPVMYALFTLLRPRRYVELGVHNSMSSSPPATWPRSSASPECVAVDSWVGDVHAGFHDTSVFDNFRAYAAENGPDQYFIQGYFSAALAWFEDGSVDLLHIDGLHTYEAVKEDFETWLPKMSDTGVIIFHDTNEFGRGFGVWRLWEELKGRYPAFEFAHQHGLGIIFVGRSSIPSPRCCAAWPNPRTTPPLPRPIAPLSARCWLSTAAPPPCLRPSARGRRRAPCRVTCPRMRTCRRATMR